MKNKKAVIIGAYGLGNLGDESVLLSTLYHYRKKGINNIVVLSFKPKKTANTYKVKSSHFLSFFALYHILTTTYFIQGGGGILDSNIAGIRNNLARYVIICGIICKLMRKKIVFHRIGFYNFGNCFYNKWLNFTLQNSKISCRDQITLKNLKKLGVTSNITLMNDAAMELNPDQIENEYKRKCDKRVKTDNKKIVGLAIRYVANKHCNQNINKVIRKILDKYKDQVKFYFLTFQKHEIKKLEDDSITASKVIGDRNIEIIDDIKHPNEMLAIIGKLDLLLATRLHANIFGYLQNTPTITISYHDKVRAFIRQIDSSQKIIDIEKLKTEHLIVLINEKL